MQTRSPRLCEYAELLSCTRICNNATGSNLGNTICRLQMAKCWLGCACVRPGRMQTRSPRLCQYAELLSCTRRCNNATGSILSNTTFRLQMAKCWLMLAWVRICASRTHAKAKPSTQMYQLRYNNATGSNLSNTNCRLQVTKCWLGCACVRPGRMRKRSPHLSE